MVDNKDSWPCREKKLFSHFSKRELECLKFLTRGYTAKETGKELHISSKTVEFHIASAKIKSGITLKSQLINFFLRQCKDSLGT